jgi:hypothetical protein
MPPFIASLAPQLTPAWSMRAPGLVRLPFIIIHFAALALMVVFENDLLRMSIYLLTWGLLNFLWLAGLRRPALAGALSLAMFATLMWVSWFKASVVWITANFTDVMIIDSETVAFLWTILPRVRTGVIIAILIGIPAGVALWRIDPWRVRRRKALAAAAGCCVPIVILSLTFPLSEGEGFRNDNFVSMFMRSGVEAVQILASQGYMESDATVTEQLQLVGSETCQPTGRLPHIIMLHDESSFDIRAVNGARVPEGYGEHFKSFDGKQRTMLVEGAGGPSWFTEYNVLAGLSARSFGRFQFYVTRIAAGRVQRGLPRALRRCGYRTFSIYPVNGAFLGTRTFFGGVGFQGFVDGQQIHGRPLEPDRFYFDHAARMIELEHTRAPMFMHVYLTANHFPYDRPFRADLTTEGWRDPGNEMPEIDEYLRRQAMTARDYRDFLSRLEREFPQEAFLIVRYGDHQPDFAKLVIDPNIDEQELGRRIQTYDPRYLSTYYAIDSINFRPGDVSSALQVLDAPYLPIVLQEAAGLPLDASFAEQKRIFQRCHGLFYACGNGAEARRFNRLLIDAGLIKGL